ncbi:MAG: molybdopterin-dependent oxidoreductase [Sulfolobales archaeon]
MVTALKTIYKSIWELGEIGGKRGLEELRIVKAICPYCSVGCSIDFYVDSDKIIWLAGSKDSYINQGALCPKGVASYQLIKNNLRFLRPMMRTGPKPPVEEILRAKSWDDLLAVIKKYPPNWRPITWDEALEYIADRLSKILAEWRRRTGAPVHKDGYFYVGRENPVQILGSSVLTNEEAYLVSKLAVYIGTSNIDSQYRKCHSSTVTGLGVTYGWGAETASLEDLSLADVVLFFSNPAEAHPLSMRHLMRAKEDRGAIFICFDPRFSRTAMVSDIWVPFRPGSDASILLYILHYAFFERDPPIDQLDEFRRLMGRWNIDQDDLEDLKDLLKDYNAEEVSRISGVPVDLLRSVARIFVERSGVVTNHKKHGIIQWAMGFTQHTNATINIIRSAAIVQLLLGNVGFPGGGTHPFRGHSNVQGATDVQGHGMGSLPGYVSPPINTLSIRVYQDWKLQGMPDAWSWEVPEWAYDKDPFKLISKPSRGQADLNKVLQVYNFYGWRRLELAWGVFCGTIPPEDPVNGTVICDFPVGIGYSEVAFVRAALRGDIKAALIFGENPVVTNPNSRLVMAALSSLDLLVVSDLFETETAWFADILLPACSFAEKEGSRTNGNRIIQWSYRVIDPIGDSRPDYWIIANIYKRLREKQGLRLPSEHCGVKDEAVIFRKRSGYIEVYRRPVEPNSSWDYSGGTGSSKPVSKLEEQVNPRIINKEINFSMLLYQGLYDPVRDIFRSMSRDNSLRNEEEIDGLFSKIYKVYKNWGWSWPQNVRFMYNYDSLSISVGRCINIEAAGRRWVVCGETGEWIDEYTGEYRPAFIPGHSFWEPRAFKRRLSGISDLFGGLDIIGFIRTGKPKIRSAFVIEEQEGVRVLNYQEFSKITGAVYLWANDTLYWDRETASLPANLKRPFFPGNGWRDFKEKYMSIRERLSRYSKELGGYREAVARIIEEDGGWYAGYDFRWPIHTEPAESPNTEFAVKYPSIAWINRYNLDMILGRVDLGIGVGDLSTIPVELAATEGELVIITSNRLTEHFHSGSMSRNLPLLRELVPEPFITIPKDAAEKLGISSGDLVELITIRGSIRLKAYVANTGQQSCWRYDEDCIPIVSITWFSGFAGAVQGPVGNILSPDAIDVVTSIQESKGWLGKLRRVIV